MTEPPRPWSAHDPGRFRRGYALGVTVPLPVAVFVGGVTGNAVVAVVVGLVVVVGSFVLLVQRGDDFLRGLGAGVLTAIAVVLLVFGACFAMIVSGGF